MTTNNRFFRSINAIAQAMFLCVSLLCSITTSAQSTTSKKIQALPRDLEIQLAVSALPPHLRDSATVYVLNPDKGFEEARKGNNGFYAFVARTGDDAMRGSWELTEYRDDILYPISFDEEGSTHQMQVFFDIAAMQAKGTSPQEVKKIIQDRYKTSYYKAPEKAGVSYMLSPVLRTYVNPEQTGDVVTINFPHMMYYAPNVSNKDVGATAPGPEQVKYLFEHGKWQQSPYPFVILPGVHGYIIQARGDEERQAITAEYKDMLAKLCALNKNWCVTDQSAALEHHHH